MRFRRWTQQLALVALQGALLAACSRAGDVKLQVGPAAPPRPAAPPVSVFQGEVASVDEGSSAFVVAVHIFWAPAMGAAAEDRRVTVGPATRWPPTQPGAGVGFLQVGEEVQVRAESGPDGSWRAIEVQVLDIE